MALSQSTLAGLLEDALNALVGPPPAPDPVQELALAFGEYFKDATLNGVVVASAAVDSLAVPAMIAGMVFPDPATNPTPAQGAEAFLSGYTEFWSAIAGAAPTFWPAAVSVTPPTELASLSSALQGQFASNNQQGITTAQAAANLAAAIHPNAGLTGVGVIVTTPFPIL